MDIATAKKINKAMVDYYLHEISHESVPAGPPPDFSLEDMLEATRIMDGYSEPGETPGSQKIFTVCGSSLVAAMYVLGNCPPADPDNLTEVVIAGNGTAVLCLRIRDVVRLERAWKKYEGDGDDDCATCGKVDPDELPESKAIDLLRQALGLLSAMSADPADGAIPEKMEDFLEEVREVFPGFVWRKAGGSYWVTTALKSFFQPKDISWQL